VTLTADATVDIAASTVNGDLDLVFNPGTETVAGAEPSVRLNYNGPLAAPALTTDVSALSNYLSLRAFEKERRRVEAMQASVLEKQRLRREVALYRSQAAERQAEKERAEAEAKAKAEEEARLKAAAEERLRQEKEQQERLQQQQQQQPAPERQSAPALVVPPTEDAIRQLAPENAPATP
jgi:flagellar biosynthesis GTPase FlhF